MSVGSGLGDAIGNMLIFGVISFSTLLVLGGYSIYDYFFMEDEYEVSAPIKPELRLVTDGKTVDTVYVYKFK